MKEQNCTKKSSKHSKAIKFWIKKKTIFLNVVVQKQIKLKIFVIKTKMYKF